MQKYPLFSKMKYPLYTEVNDIDINLHQNMKPNIEFRTQSWKLNEFNKAQMQVEKFSTKDGNSTKILVIYN